MNHRRKLVIALGAGALAVPLVLKKSGEYAPNKDRAVCAFTVLVVVWAALTMTTAVAADYPARPIRFIVPYAAGGGPDVSARLLATELTRQMGQQIVVDNRPGAGGSIGTEMIVRAVPDGYSIGYVSISNLVLNRSLLANLPYDTDKDLQMVVQMVSSFTLLGVTPSLPAKSVRELIDYAKNNPGKLSYASTGNGTIQHIAAELFRLMTGIQIVHVPYKGDPQALTELGGGQVHFMFESVAAILPHVKAGRVRGLAVSSAKRSAIVPELPTIAEAGVPGYEMTTWAGVAVPAEVPRAMVARLNTEFNKALTVPMVKEKLAGLGYDLAGGTPEQFAEFSRTESVKWARVIKTAGIRTD